MSKIIMIGCDLHDRTMLIRFATGTEEPQQAVYDNDTRGRREMIHRLKKLAQKRGASRIVFAYEASGLGFHLCDELHDAGIECHVLSPTHLPKTPKSAKLKTDAKDAQVILEQLRGHLLAGNKLPAVWTPPQRLRDDRELVRARIKVGDEIARVKVQIKSILKRYPLKIALPTASRWPKGFFAQVRKKALPELELTVSTTLDCLLERYEGLLAQRSKLDRGLQLLAKTDRYKHAHAELRKLPGVGLLTAMTFLTEMGDLTRFSNRREVGAYLGLCPSSHESGEANDRKGRITGQGPSHLRKMLCQASWISLRDSESAAADYHRIKQGQNKRTKKAIVALMRKLGIKMWHAALSCGVHRELIGRGGPRALETSARAQQRGEPFASPSPRPLGSCAG
jgi:transposase